MSDNVDQAVNLLTQHLTFILDEMAPIKTIQMRTNYAPWLSKQTKILIQERNHAQELSARSGDQDYWRIFKHIRNRVSNILKK